MSVRLYLFCCLLLSLVAGCGGGSPLYAPHVAMKAAPASPSLYATTNVPQPGTSADSSLEASRHAYEGKREAQHPTERPGLGTEWGETRVSRVHEVSFVRADAEHPFAVATLHYDDRDGIQALSQYHAAPAPAFRGLPAAGGAITISVRDESGGPLEGFYVGDRNYVVGRAGQRYVLSLTNHTGHRFEVVATVDGLDVINGQPGALDHFGYVLGPFATLDIEGFRQNEDAVAAFRFAAVHDSYAAQTGNARNVGVIGVALFAERGDSFDSPSPDELYLRDTANPFPSSGGRFARPPVR